MENISNNIAPLKDRDVFYFRQRMKNRVFAKIVSFFSEEAERTGITKKDIAANLKRDPAQISRWLSSPTNMTLETISDLLLAMGAEIDPPKIVRFLDKARPNHAHPLIDSITARGLLGAQPKKPDSVSITLAPPKGASIKANLTAGSKNSPSDKVQKITVMA